jgi:hypothetical protein
MFLAAVVVFPLAALNPWPFSNWELFSRLRTDQQTGWKAVAVDSAGRERDYPIASLAPGHRGFPSLLAAFSERSAAVRHSICVAWLRGAAEEFGPSTELLRIYHREWLLSDRQGNRAAPPHLTLAWTCSERRA